MDSSTTQFRAGPANDSRTTGFVISQPNFVTKNVSDSLDKRLKYKSLSLSQNGSTENVDLLSSSCSTELRNKSASLHVANFGLMNEMDESGNGRLCKKSLDASVYLTSPLPQVSSSVKDLPRLFPPGRILHIVRKYPKSSSSRRASTESQRSEEDLEQGEEELKESCEKLTATKHAFKEYKSPSSKKNTPTSKSFQTVSPVTYQVIETDNKHFNELLISPRMLQDHIPDNLIKCMRAVLDESGGLKRPPTTKVNHRNQATTLNVINEQPNSVGTPMIEDIASPTETSKENVRKSKRRSVLESITHSFSSNETTAAVDPTKQQRRNSSHSLQKFLSFSRLKNVPIVKQYVLNSSNRRKVTQDHDHNDDGDDVKLTVNKNYVSSSVLDNGDPDSRFKQMLSQQRQFKSLSLCSYDNSHNSALTPAPLAKPESCSDLLNEIEEALSDKTFRLLRLAHKASADDQAAASSKEANEDEANSQTCAGSIYNNENEQDNNITFYDESFNFKNSLFELQNDQENEEVNQISNQERAIYRKHAIGNHRGVRSHHGQQLDDDNEVKSSIIWVRVELMIVFSYLSLSLSFLWN